ncbi:Uncharacterised protein (plasmid) [Tsukamurella tyrosinosolvens]|uniref:Trypsin n=1 Tax=Tsukamurella tyrosinosolvens TaxID=57704 RepID=A0A1H4VGK5_TSUTY|nr:hypothetical protein [Tsukamurella tyrosinosolvens]KXO90979.1 hypothetical protein AXK58_21345 [Tsukamurella tyrosinosolvens]SEC80232.1 hypothetical protein SAMN04489793_3225 [Tsukamurella tyrosinosolvens]VEH90524.1 Uncharacterised protein [Tsukamurella tyrosinosolvens]
MSNRLRSCIRALAAVLATAGALAAVAPTAAAAPLDSQDWVAPASLGQYSKGPQGLMTASGFRPGTGFVIEDEGRVTTCTIGFAVTSPLGMSGFITAGHCDVASGVQGYAFQDTQGLLKLPIPPLSVANTASAHASGTADDSAVVWDTAGSAAPSRFDPSLTGTRLVGTMSENDARKLPAGTPICFSGATSGTTCGRVLSASGDSLSLDVPSLPGDSGGPVFVVNATGQAVGVGVVSGNLDGHAKAVFLEPALKRLGATASVHKY